MTAAIPILTDAEAGRIAAIAARLQSDHEGEIVNAGRMLVRSLDKHGLRLGDVLMRALKPVPVSPTYSAYKPDPVTPMASHQRQARECIGFPDGVITRWEEEFIASILHQRKISPKQQEILTKIVAKVRRHRGDI